MPRKRQPASPHIFWRNGRAYADFRSYSDVGGRRAALSEPGSTWGTTDPDVAGELFAAKLEELREKRRGRVGVPQPKSITLDALVRDHLLKRHEAGNTSHPHMLGLEGSGDEAERAPLFAYIPPDPEPDRSPGLEYTLDRLRNPRLSRVQIAGLQFPGR